MANKKNSPQLDFISPVCYNQRKTILPILYHSPRKKSIAEKAIGTIEAKIPLFFT